MRGLIRHLTQRLAEAIGRPEHGSQPLRRRQLAVRAVLVLGAVILAYHYSLETLIRNLYLDTPLAYLGLVPFIALGLVLICGLAPRREPDIHDRYVDYIIGAPMLLTALMFLLVLPATASSFFWFWRLDLISMPLFVAGAVSIVFGVRALWRLKWPIAFLFFAWPLPYTGLLNSWLLASTSVTLAGLKFVLHALPVAQSVDSLDGSVFAVVHNGHRFLIGIASACAGANGTVAFILVAAAFLPIVRGRWLARLAWLAAGVSLIWLLNLGRLLLILAAGQRFGEQAAINVLHPFLGLVTFNLGVLAMILALPLFRIRMGVLPVVSRAAPLPTTPRTMARRSRPPVARAGVAFAVVMLAAIVAGVANAGMREFELLSHDLGAPRLTGLDASNSVVAGWTVGQSDQFPWIRRYFGDDANWTRYTYTWQPGVPIASSYQDRVPVTLDVLSTGDLGSLSAFGLEACYRFHNYQLIDVHRVELGGGVVGHSVIYYNPKQDVNWLAVYWEWPVRTAGGERYQRVVLNMSNPARSDLSGYPDRPNLAGTLGIAISDWIAGGEGRLKDPQLVSARDFLTEFAQHVVKSAASGSARASGQQGA